MTGTDKTITRNFSDNDWANTPDVVKTEYEQLEKTVVKLVDENEQLRERLYKLEVTANKNPPIGGERRSGRFANPF